MSTMTSREIRQHFLDFFASKGHQIVPSAPMVVKNDPTLMFINSGMAPFKDIFLGISPVKFPRVADTQKCLRVSGKHNDLEDVGLDTYHHTLFEMLGNWSFGDYFKKEAIAWAWELLTEVYKLDKNRLYVTVFEGDAKEGLAPDEEARSIWKQYIAEERILNGNKKDNFWEMGDMGPCGPCSEIHVDLRTDAERAAVDGKTLVNNDHPQVVEIWNNVFMEFERMANGALRPLPNKHVDTGMGFERLCMALQGKTSNYDTDVFQPLIQFIAKKSGIAYGSHFSQENKTITPSPLERAGERSDVAMRVIADHIRAISFTITDGQLPSNTGAGYVIRRILRRAVRYGYTFLGFKEPFLYQLVDILAMQFDGVFPELKAQQDFVKKVILEEETSFLRTLEKGLIVLKEQIEYMDKIQEFLDIHYGKEWQDFSLLQVTDYSDFKVNTVVDNLANHISSNIPVPERGRYRYYEIRSILKNITDYDLAFDALKNHCTYLDPKIAFELYDTNGFPIDLTELILRECHYKLDRHSFDMLMNLQKDRARKATSIDTEDWVEILPAVDTEFVGYDKLECKSRIIKYRKVKAKGKELYQLVLDKTPFYAESGGQIGDTGVLENKLNDIIGPERINIVDTKKENNLIVHLVETLPLDPSSDFLAKVDAQKRRLTANNHSATHLLHAALKQVLGSHVNQKGSLVNDEYLRFDFSHFSKVSDEEIQQIENIVNQKIRENIALDEQRNVPYEQALQSGVTALFGEKYGDFVRVITFDPAFSKELCGGIHVPATGQIAQLKIVAESAVAAGVRRIEAITADAAAAYFAEQAALLASVKEALKNPADLLKSIQGLLEENNRMKKELEQVMLAKAGFFKADLLQKIQAKNGLNLIAEKIALPSAEAIKNLAFELKGEVDNLFLVLAAEVDGKPHLTVILSDNLVKEKNLNASTIVRELGKEIQGGGGGQPFYATAGGKDLSGLDRAIAKSISLI